MKLLLSILIALAFILPSATFAGQPDNFASSLTLNEANPVFGQDITFTAIYPTDAAQTPKRTQQHYNPQIQVDCYQDGVHVYTINQSMDTKTRISGGWISITYPITLSQYGYNGHYWTSGGATCVGSLYSYQVGVLTIWASNQFEVGP
jgi:hypothetical protein